MGSKKFYGVTGKSQEFHRKIKISIKKSRLGERVVVFRVKH